MTARCSRAEPPGPGGPVFFVGGCVWRRPGSSAELRFSHPTRWALRGEVRLRGFLPIAPKIQNLTGRVVVSVSGGEGTEEPLLRSS